MSRSFVFAACILAACSTTASAQSSFGRLVDPKALATFADETCSIGAKTSNTALAAKAARSKWDELGRTAATPKGSRAWMVSLKGQPVIVDVTQNSKSRTCSVSAVTDPNSVILSVARQRGLKPRTKSAQGNTVATWPASRIQPLLEVIYGGGRAMARITYTFAPTT